MDNDLYQTAMLPLSGQSTLQYNVSEMNSDFEILEEDVIQREYHLGSGISQQPQPPHSMWNHAILSNSFNQSAGYNSVIQNAFDTPVNSFYPDDPNHGTMLIDGNDWLMPPAVGLNYMNAFMLNNLIDPGVFSNHDLIDLYTRAPNRNQQGEHGNTAYCDGFDPTSSSSLISSANNQYEIDLQSYIGNTAYWITPQESNNLPVHNIINTAHYFRDTTIYNINECENQEVTSLENPTVCNTNYDSEQNRPQIPCEMRDSKPKRKREGGIKKNRHSKKAWEFMRDNHIQRLFDAGLTQEEVAFQLTVVYHFPTTSSTLSKKYSKWGPAFKRNNRAEHHNGDNEMNRRTRPAQKLPKTNVAAPKRNIEYIFILNSDALKRQYSISPHPSLIFQPSIHSEISLHHLDHLIKGCLGRDTKGKGWAFGDSSSSSFIPPVGTRDNSRSWWILATQCSAIPLLGDAMLYDRVFSLFNNILKRAAMATKCCDPNFLITFWKICQSLCHLRFPKHRPFILLRVLLWHLRLGFSRSLGNHALVKFLDSLIIVLDASPRDFRTTIGKACWKTIDTLLNSAHIPHDHRIIMNMGSYCTKNWKNEYVSRMELLHPVYNKLIQACSDTEVQEKISLLYDYVEAISTAKYNSQYVVDRATELWMLSADICGKAVKEQRLIWTDYTQALAFSTELVARHNLECKNQDGRSISSSDDRSNGFQYMSWAIEILRQGDLQCRIRAFSFSRRLGLWLKAYPERENSKKERQEALKKEKCRRVEILECIPKAAITALESQSLPIREKRGNQTTRWRRKLRMARDTFCSHLPIHEPGLESPSS